MCKILTPTYFSVQAHFCALFSPFSHHSFLILMANKISDDLQGPRTLRHTPPACRHNTRVFDAEVRRKFN
jgi:hypothetical protein